MENIVVKQKKNKKKFTFQIQHTIWMKNKISFLKLAFYQKRKIKLKK